jgi:DNA-binding transcriptional ArsR family regulator
MVNFKSSVLDSTFAALSDPTRRGIIAKLARGELSVTALAEPYAMSLPAVSKHLRVLENAGLIERRKVGRTHHCRLTPKPMQRASDWLSRYRAFWDSQFDNLAGHLEKTSEKNR